MSVSISVSVALADFRLALEADGRAAKTVAWYVDLLSQSPTNMQAWLSERRLTMLTTVTTKDLREYIVWLRNQRVQRDGAPFSEATVNAYIRASHRFWAWCTAEYRIPNPMSRIAHPKSKEAKPKAISLEDARALLAVCGDDAMGRRNRAILMFLIDTGCRAQGLCGLKWGDIEVLNRRALVTEKGNKTRYVMFTDETALVLADWIAVSRHFAYVFYDLDTGEGLTVSGLRHMLARLARRAKVTGRVNPHSFRHMFAREYLLAGGDLATLSTLMGHEQVQTTVSNYTIFTDRELKDKHEQFSPVKKL